MYPNSYQYQPPVAVQAGGVSRKLLIGIIGGVVLLIVAIGLIVLSRGAGSGDTMARVTARQNALLAMADEAHDKIVGAELKKLNGDAILFMTSDAATMTTVLKQLGIERLPKEIAAEEATDSSVTERLTQADAAGRFDDTYVTVLAQQIDEQQALLTSAQGGIGNPAAQAVLKRAYDNFEAVQQQLKRL